MRCEVESFWGSLKTLLKSDDMAASPGSHRLTCSSYSKSVGSVLLKLEYHKLPVYSKLFLSWNLKDCSQDIPTMWVMDHTLHSLCKVFRLKATSV